MAHMIDESTGAPAIAYAGNSPWHKLGRQMGEAERHNLAAALKLAGLDWTVDARPIYFAPPSPANAQDAPPQQYRAVADAQGIIRLDTGAYLGTVGKGFTPIQNRDAFDVLDPLITEHKCTVEVMASLDGGRRQFALVRMPDATITPQPGDDVRGYILVTNAHDGSAALRATLTPIRVVCQNTLSASFEARHATAVHIRHTKSAPDRLKQAAEIVDRMQHAMAKTGDTYKTLAERQMTPKEIAAYIETVIPNPKKDEPISATLTARREAIADLIFHGHHTDDGAADPKYGYASAWRAYNGVTEYFDHVRAREAKSPEGKRSAYDSALFGGNAVIKANALRELVAA